MTFAQALRQTGLPAREARLLVAEAVGIPVATVLAYPERVLSPGEEERYLALARRRLAGEPVAYILGRKEFYGLELEVGPAVLVPRPETELLVELALELPFAAAADVGTGSGAIALALKRARPEARIVGVEASADALAVARRNAARHGLEVDFREGRFMEPLGAASFDLIVANLPYVAAGDPHLEALRFEPAMALVGSGADGLGDLRTLIHQAPPFLAGQGWILLEHGLGQEAAVAAALSEAGFGSVRTWPDLAGIARVTGAQRSPER